MNLSVQIGLVGNKGAARLQSGGCLLLQAAIAGSDACARPCAIVPSACSSGFTARSLWPSLSRPMRKVRRRLRALQRYACDSLRAQAGQAALRHSAPRDLAIQTNDSMTPQTGMAAGWRGCHSQDLREARHGLSSLPASRALSNPPGTFTLSWPRIDGPHTDRRR